MKVLILFAHPALQKSKVNKFLVDGIGDLENVTFHDLYEAYPELDIDIKYEQELLTGHDVIIFQFPLFWYSTPAILKEWQDLVLEHGWAYGSKGIALKDKLFFCVISTGGPRRAYQVEGFHNHTLNQLISPLSQTARLCKMIPVSPFVINGSHIIEPDELNNFKAEYFSLLGKLVLEEIDIKKAEKVEYLNDY